MAISDNLIYQTEATADGTHFDNVSGQAGAPKEGATTVAALSTVQGEGGRYATVHVSANESNVLLPSTDTSWVASDFTAAARIRSDATSTGTQAALSAYLGSSQWWQIGRQNDNRVNAVFSRSFSTSNAQTLNADVSVETVIVATYEAATGTVRLYDPADASVELDSAVLSSPYTVDATGEVAIGVRPDNINNALDGEVYWTAVWGRILPQNEIEYLDGSPYPFSAPAPTITNINTANEVTPGVTATLTGTNLTNATGLNIGSVSQSNFKVVNDTTVTFTGTRGGNPYNQDLTATLLSPDGNATITVQQVPEAGTFAVAAASPNTTDDASLWANTVDTATGDPVTVVNGDQFWVNSTIPGLAIDPTGAITANETGTFTGQFWRASEGVWGSDQTVSFTLPEEDDPAPPAFGRRLKKALNLTLKNSLRTDI